MKTGAIIGTILAIAVVGGVGYYLYARKVAADALAASDALSASQAAVDEANQKLQETTDELNAAKDAASKVTAKAKQTVAKAAQATAIATQNDEIKRADLFHKGDSIQFLQNITIPLVKSDVFGAWSQDSLNGANLAKFFYKNVPVGTVFATTQKGKIVVQLVDGKLGMISSLYVTMAAPNAVASNNITADNSDFGLSGVNGL